MPDWLDRIINWHRRHDTRIDELERKIDSMAATLADLDAKIAATPQAVADAVVAVIPPASGPVDVQAQVDALSAVPDQAAALIQQALASRPPA